MVPPAQQLFVSGTETDPNIYQATVYSTGAVLALVVWDALVSLDNEVDHIWSKPGRAYVKWIYLFTRWFGLVNQACLQIWRSYLASRFPAPPSTCATFYVFEAVTFELLQLCLDATLVLRIWAVYQRRYPYVAIALLLVFSEILALIGTQTITVSKSVIDGSCIMLHVPMAASSLGVAILVSQTVLLALTFRGTFLMKSAARRSQIISVVVRDGVFVSCIVMGIVLITVIYLLFNQSIVNILLPWMPLGPSLLTPRIILNMQMAAEPSESILEFTTDLGTIPGCDIPLENGDESCTNNVTRDVP